MFPELSEEEQEELLRAIIGSQYRATQTQIITCGVLLFVAFIALAVWIL